MSGQKRLICERRSWTKLKLVALRSDDGRSAVIKPSIWRQRQRPLIKVASTALDCSSVPAMKVKAGLAVVRVEQIDETATECSAMWNYRARAFSIRPT